MPVLHPDLFFFYVLYSPLLLHLPPLRFHCADGCWDRTQDRYNWCIGSQTLNISSYQTSELVCVKAAVGVDVGNRPGSDDATVGGPTGNSHN